MPIEIQCMHCKRKLRVAEKFAGKHAKCPGCQGNIDIPALESTEGTSGEASDSKAKKQASDSKTAAQSPAKEAAKSSPSSKSGSPRPAARAKEEWYLKTDDDAEYGPVTKAELDSWAEDGRIDSSCQLLRQGWEEWKWAEEVYPQFAEGPKQAEQSVPQAPAQAEADGFDLDAITGGGGGGHGGAHDNPLGDLDFASEPSRPMRSSKPTSVSRQKNISRQAASEPTEAASEGVGLSPAAQKSLAQMQPWTKFFSILLFVGAGFAGLRGLWRLVELWRFLFVMGALEKIPWLGVASLIHLVEALTSLAVVGGYGFAGFQLFRGSTRIQKYLRQKRIADLETGLALQKTSWIFLGIATAAFLFAMVLSIIGGVAIEALLRAQHR